MKEGHEAPHILVVDDEADIRQLVRDILEDGHYSVATAEDAAAARMRPRSPPDLILPRHLMPDLDGISLLKEVVGRSRPGMSGDHDVRSWHGRDRRRGNPSGAYDFLESRCRWPKAGR